MDKDWFKIIEEKKSWMDARDYCIHNASCDSNRTGSLAIPKNNVENYFISSVMAMKGSFYWIGGYRNIDIEKSLSDGVAIPYKNHIFTLKFFHSWYFLGQYNDTPIWKNPEKCYSQKFYPHVSCTDDFHAFAVGNISLQ